MGLLEAAVSSRVVAVTDPVGMLPSRPRGDIRGVN